MELLADHIDTMCVWFAGLPDAVSVAGTGGAPVDGGGLPFHIHLGLVFQLDGRSYKLFSMLSVSS